MLQQRRTRLLAMVILASVTTAAAQPPTKPKGLKPGDTIALIAPSGPLREESIVLATQRLEGLGYEVRSPEDLFRRRGYLAGDDQRRADEFTAAFADPEVDAVFPGTGGYGATRMLDLIDWEVVRSNPKVFIGFSDVTALHLAIDAKCDFVTFHTPNPQYGLGSEGDLSPFSARYFWRCLMASQNEGEQGFEYENPPDYGGMRAIAAGVGRGRLTGGNLSLVAALMGTPYEVQTEGRILFLEDVAEEPYRVDRMLSTLKLAGKLDAPAAVLLGRFTRGEPDEPERSLSFVEVFDDYFTDAPYPVIANFAAGHGERGDKRSLNTSLPFGVMAEVDADTLRVRVLENPVTAE